MTKFSLLVTAALIAPFASYGAAHAEEAPVTDVSELLVTATRAPVDPSRVGQSVSLVTREMLEESQTLVISDAIARVPGVQVTRNGGEGQATALRIRGAETDQTLVLIDGVRLNDPSAVGAGYNFGNLIAGDIQHLEVLRGAQSVLWGSQAIGGVVNVATAEPTEALSGRISAEYGARDTGYFSAAASAKTGPAAWRIGASRFHTDGVSVARVGREADSYDNTQLTGRLDLSLPAGLGLDLRGFYSRGRNEYDGYPPPTYSFADTAEYGRTEDFVGYAGLKGSLLGGRLRNRLGLGYTQTDRITWDPDQAVTTVTFVAKGRNTRLEYQGVLDLGDDWKATFGLEQERSRMRTAAPSAFDPAPASQSFTVDLTSGYFQVNGPVLPGLNLTGGLRRDDHETFGGQTLAQVAAAWSLNDGRSVLRASWGEGFKAPSLYQLNSEYGNSALRPERARIWDLSLQQDMLEGRLSVTAAVFRRVTRDQIDWVNCFSPTQAFCAPAGVARYGYYDNIARTTASGAELAGSLDLDSLRIEAAYTWIDAKNRSAGVLNGARLARRPEHQLNVTLSHEWSSGAEAALVVRYGGSSYDDAANTYRLRSYTLVDVRGSLPVSDTVELYGRIENLFDEDYEIVRNYGVAGRGLFVGVRARF